MTQNIMRTPREIEIEITSRCNLRCKYCYYFSGVGDVKQDDLSTEEWLRFFVELNRCTVLKVTLQGGEPFIREDILDIIRGIVENRMRFVILTNGTLVTDELAEFLHSTGRCDRVQVSIDGSSPENHDAFRGTGSFRKAIEGIEILRKHKVRVNSRVTIHKKNVRDLEAIAYLLLEEVGLPSFSINSAIYMGLCRHDTDNIQLDVEERSMAMEKLLKLSQKYKGRIASAAGPLSEAKSWLQMIKAHREKKKLSNNGGYLAGCGGIFSKMGVRADGVMVPCIHLGHIELGIINKDDLKDVWQNHPEYQKLRNRRTIPLTAFSFCDGCDYIDYCTGNCPGTAYTILGDDQHPGPDVCLKRFLDEGGQLPDENLLLNHN